MFHSFQKTRPHLPPRRATAHGKGAVPALSADHKYIAFGSEDRIGLFDIVQKKVAVVQKTPCDLNWPHMAFSPSGRKIGCIAKGQVLVWDTASGRLESNFTTRGSSIDFPDEGFILVDEEFLIALDSRITLWSYKGSQPIRTIGGVTFFGVLGVDGSVGFLAAKVPHTEATSVLTQALKNPGFFFFFRPGTPVKLNLSAVPESHRQRVVDGTCQRV